MSAAIVEETEPNTDPADIARDQLEELARCVLIHWLRRREYSDKFTVFAHQLLLRMQTMGIKVIDGDRYTIRLRPSKHREHLSPSRRRAARRWNYGAILTNDGLPPYVSIEKKVSA